MNEDERSDDGLTTAQAWVFGLIAGVLVIALMGIAYAIGFDRGEEEGRGQAEPAAEGEPAPGGETTTETTPAPADGPGRELFASSCGSCHTLADAETTGTAGPDLDLLAPDEARVLAAIENGGTGSGGMPANLLEGAEAEEVAAYVAAAAGAE
jgi:mono/diheme cytochrome c family protein